VRSVPIADYDPSAFPPFAVTVDLVVLTVHDGVCNVLLVERGVDPYAGMLALPGGFVRADEDLPDAARRELVEETGIAVSRVHLEQLGSYGTPARDPRMRVVSVAYLVLAPALGPVQAGTDAATAQWVPVTKALRSKLAFDHRRVLADGVERARAKLEYTTLATSFCAKEFTITDLRRVYEAIWGVELDPRNFHRKVMATEGFVTEVAGATVSTGGRPAQVFRAGPAPTLHPPLVR
jgi:8-oxo-dGTP diphosphatase